MKQCAFCANPNEDDLVRSLDHPNKEVWLCKPGLWMNMGCERRAAVQRIWDLTPEEAAILRPGPTGGPVN